MIKSIFRFNFDGLLQRSSLRFPTERPDQRGGAGVCVGRHDMCLAL